MDKIDWYKQVNKPRADLLYPLRHVDVGCSLLHDHVESITQDTNFWLNPSDNYNRLIDIAFEIAPHLLPELKGNYERDWVLKNWIHGLHQLYLRYYGREVTDCYVKFGVVEQCIHYLLSEKQYVGMKEYLTEILLGLDVDEYLVRALESGTYSAALQELRGRLSSLVKFIQEIATLTEGDDSYIGVSE